MKSRFSQFVIVAVVISLVAGIAIFGKDFPSYLKTFRGQVEDGVKERISVKTEADRAGILMEDSRSEYQNYVRVVAEQEVQIVSLKQDIAQSQEVTKDMSHKVQTLRTALKTPNEQFLFSGRQYSRNEVLADLDKRLESLKEAEKTLEAKRHLLADQEATLASNLQELKNYEHEKEMYRIKIQGLAAREQVLELKESTSQLHIDRSKFGQVKKVVDEQEKRLLVREKMLEVDEQTTGMIPLDVVSEADVLSKVDAYLLTKDSSAEDAKTGTEGSLEVPLDRP